MIDLSTLQFINIKSCKNIKRKTPETPFANVKDGLQSQPQVWEDSTVCMVRTEFDSPAPILKTKQNLPLTLPKPGQ